MEKLLEVLADFFYSQYLRWTKYQADKELFLGGLKRASDWSQFVKEFAKIKPKVCSIVKCKRKDIELHHSEEPFHINPAREKDPTNLEWFCRIHHFEIGHLFNWKSWNKELAIFVAYFNNLIANRP